MNNKKLRNFFKMNENGNNTKIYLHLDIFYISKIWFFDDMLQFMSMS